jgi:hypothetical protein
MTVKNAMNRNLANATHGGFGSSRFISLRFVAI